MKQFDHEQANDASWLAAIALPVNAAGYHFGTSICCCESQVELNSFKRPARGYNQRQGCAFLVCFSSCEGPDSSPYSALATDPKTRKEWAKFNQLVDRTLQSFDSVSEWADFITFLGKLLKVRLMRVPICDQRYHGYGMLTLLLRKCLQAYPSFSDVPHKLVVAKRLAQCLNPALPTGVHQRALDVYVHILSAIGVRSTSPSYLATTELLCKSARQSTTRSTALVVRSIPFLPICCNLDTADSTGHLFQILHPSARGFTTGYESLDHSIVART